MGDNGNIVNEMEQEAALARANLIISESHRPESPLRAAQGSSGGLLTNYQRANKEDEILQELKQGIWGNFDQADKICAALDELELLGLPFTPVLRRLAALNAGQGGFRMKELLKAYSHITLGNDGDSSGVTKKGMFSRFTKSSDPIG